jgi:hypothetical protein
VISKLTKQNNGFKNTLVISKGPAIEDKLLEEPITQIKATFEDSNSDDRCGLQNAIYENRDARVLDFISTILSDGKVRDYTKKLTIKKWLCKLVHLITEDYGTYIYGLPQAPFTSENILEEMMLKL